MLSIDYTLLSIYYYSQLRKFLDHLFACLSARFVVVPVHRSCFRNTYLVLDDCSLTIIPSGRAIENFIRCKRIMSLREFAHVSVMRGINLALCNVIVDKSKSKSRDDYKTSDLNLKGTIFAV